MKSLLLNLKSGMNESILVLGMIGVLLILFTPISYGVLDFLLLLNFCTALLILLVTFYIEKPLSFSTFPSLLLMTTLFRLALNISSTRLILEDAQAGKVISAIGTQVIGGSYIIGLVVFLILIVVQFIVVTNGAQRVAEVAARFILDSLPGKQMSIDADLNMGIIDQSEAKKRRSELERESNFYGAMDGASKFVKGDAIAGIIIIFINIIGGLIIGVAQKGMNWGAALHIYTLLTVGDGIVTQIPALIIAVSAGIIITRAATDARLADEIANQFSTHPRTLIIVAGALIGLALVPGIPSIPIIIIVSILGCLAWFSHKKNISLSASHGNNKIQNASPAEESLYESVKPKLFEIGFGVQLSDVYLSSSSGFEKRVELIKKTFVERYGVVLPTLIAKIDKSLGPNQYSLRVSGVEVGKGDIRPNKILAIDSGKTKTDIEGEKTREPTYGLEALWIDNEIRAQAHAAGFTLVEAETVLITHMQELCRKNAAEFISRAETERLVESRRDDLGSLIDELIPSILSYSDIQKILQSLVSEHVPINNLEAILEVLVDVGRSIKDADILTEKVRQKLSSAICFNLNDANGALNVLVLAPTLERKLTNSATNIEMRNIGLSPADLELFVSKISKECEKMLNVNLHPVLLSPASLRRPLKELLLRICPQLSILSTAEITKHPNIVSAGFIELEQSSSPRVASK